MIYQRLINSNLSNKLCFYKKVLANHSAWMSHTTAKDGQEYDRVIYNNMSKLYHKLNDVVTLGWHRHWRRTVVNHIPITENSQILDAPGGTGLITMRILEKAKKFTDDSNFCVTVYDINPAMMQIGQEKLKELGYNQKFARWIEGDIHKLPFEDGSFDTYVMFFAIRQNIDFNQMFKEANRVLKPSGKIVIGDICYFKEPTILQSLYVKYLKTVANRINYLLFKNNDSALFLYEHVINLPSQNETLAILENAGFKHVQFIPFATKIAGIYIGYKM